MLRKLIHSLLRGNRKTPPGYQIPYEWTSGWQTSSGTYTAPQNWQCNLQFASGSAFASPQAFADSLGSENHSSSGASLLFSGDVYACMGLAVAAAGKVRGCLYRILAWDIAEHLTDKLHFVGSASPAMRMLREARERACRGEPVVVLVEEIDGLFTERHREREALIAALKELRRTVQTCPSLTLIATTFVRDYLAPQMVTDGLCDRHVIVADPDARRAFR